MYIAVSKYKVHGLSRSLEIVKRQPTGFNFSLFSLVWRWVLNTEIWPKSDALKAFKLSESIAPGCKSLLNLLLCYVSNLTMLSLGFLVQCRLRLTCSIKAYQTLLDQACSKPFRLLF